MKIQKYLCNIANYTVRILFALIILWLCLQSIFSTGFIGVITREDGSLQERTRNIADSPLRHLLVFILFTAFLVLVRRFWQYIQTGKVLSAVMERRKGLYFFHRKSAPDDCKPAGYEKSMDIKPTVSKTVTLFCILLGVVSCIWILVTQLAPISDPAKVYSVAAEWREKNFSGMAEGGYLFRCPHQAGMVLYYYLLSFLLGVDNFVGIQLINAAALVFIYYFLAKSAGYCWKEDKKIQPSVYLGLIVWAPPFFYITYLYGILPGMACGLAAVYMTIQYFEKRKYRYMAAAALGIGVATVFKVNFLVYMIAIVCMLVYDMIVISGMKEKIRSLLFIFLLILGVKGCNLAVEGYVEHLSGHEISQGEAMMSYVGMGLQDGALGPGSYNGYIGDMFVKYHYDTELITEASIADIKGILKKFLENPLEEGIPFFAEKIAFQWNDPTFSGIFLSKNRPSAITPPDFVQSIIKGGASIRISVFLNDVQTLILLGVLCCLLFYRRSKNMYELFGAVIFIGGFLFHCFWEANSPYAIPYYAVIIPYAVKGWLEIARRVDDRIEQLMLSKRMTGTAESNSDSSNNALTKTTYTIKISSVIIFLMLFVIFSRTNLFSNTIALNDGTEAEEQFYHRASARESALGIESGYYTISPYLADEYRLLEQDENIKITNVINKAEDNAVYDSSHNAVNDAAQDSSQNTERDASHIAAPAPPYEAPQIALVINSEKATLRFRGSEKTLAVLPDENNRLTAYMDDTKNLFYDYEQKANTKWTLETAGEESYFILMDGWALTYNIEENRVFLEVYEGKDTQKWTIK